MTIADSRFFKKVIRIFKRMSENTKDCTPEPPGGGDGPESLESSTDGS